MNNDPMLRPADEFVDAVDEKRLLPMERVKFNSMRLIVTGPKDHRPVNLREDWMEGVEEWDRIVWPDAQTDPPVDIMAETISKKRDEAAKARKEWAEQNRGQILAEVELDRIAHENADIDIMAETRRMLG